MSTFLSGKCSLYKQNVTKFGLRTFKELYAEICHQVEVFAATISYMKRSFKVSRSVGSYAVKLQLIEVK